MKHQVNARGLIALASGLKNLTELDVGGCERVDDAALRALCSMNAHFLNLSGCAAITESGVASIAMNCTALSSLNVTGCPSIGRRFMAELCHSMKLSEPAQAFFGFQVRGMYAQSEIIPELAAHKSWVYRAVGVFNFKGSARTLMCARCVSTSFVSRAMSLFFLSGTRLQGTRYFPIRQSTRIVRRKIFVLSSGGVRPSKQYMYESHRLEASCDRLLLTKMKCSRLLSSQSRHFTVQYLSILVSGLPKHVTLRQ